ncbi:translation initiation factor IF-2, partial [Diplodia intermedia]
MMRRQALRRRAISSSRPTQNFGGGGVTAQQQQQRNDADAERDALWRNRFNVAPEPPTVRPPMQPVMRRQQQPQQTQSAAVDPETAALQARFGKPAAPAAPPPSPPPSFEHEPQVQVEHARQLREQQKEEEMGRFDPSKTAQWAHMTPRSREAPEQKREERRPQQPQHGSVVRRVELKREDGDKSFVALSPARRQQDQERMLSRFNLGGGAQEQEQEQQPRPREFVRPASLRTQTPSASPSSTGDAEKDVLNAMFKPAPPPPPPADPEPFSFPARSQSRAEPRPSYERDYLRRDQFSGSPARSQHSYERDYSQRDQFSRSLVEPRPSYERDYPPGDQSSTSPAANQSAPAENLEAGQLQETQEVQPQETQEAQPQETQQVQLQQLEQISAQQVRERERASRFSKFADVEEEEAPRRRKPKGGRSRDAYEEEEIDFSRIERKSKKKDKRKQRVTEVAPPTPIYLPEYISVVNLANMLRIRTEDLVNKMLQLGYEDINNDDVLNAENAGLIAMEYNFEPVAADPSDDVDLYPAPEPEDKTILPARPPVITIMGHVDHGKTTLLDYLRKSSVAATEFGGITQHIGAFSVPLANDKTITFLDTPGHAAFLNMRQRGANVTDIVILVVAADDSVKPQTLEAIKHANSARVPIIVAINKIDKEGANPERVKQDLARHGVDVEDFGGDIQAIPVSGKTGEGMQDLEEAAITLSEILDHRADPDGPVEGWVLEASTKRSGKAATVLVRRGTLKVGSIIVAGQTFARVRSIKNEAGVDISTVGPGMPAEIDGWRGPPEAGDEVLEAPNEQRATEVVEYREANMDRIQMAKDMQAINEARRLEHEKRERQRERERALAAAAEAGEEDPEAAVAAAEREGLDATEKASGPQEIPFVLKADVSGSVEAVVDYVMTVGNGEVRPRVIRTGVGAVSESDVELAATTGGHIVAFNTAVEPRMASMAHAMGVRLLEQNVIYRLVDDVKALLSERLAPSVTYRVTGEAAVLEVFGINSGRRKTTAVAGCRVTNGVINARSR